MIRRKAGQDPDYIYKEGEALFNAFFNDGTPDDGISDYGALFDKYVQTHASKRYLDYVDELRRERAAEAARYDVYHAG